MSGKSTLPTASRLAIYKMRVVDRLSYAAISARTGVRKRTVEDICTNPGRLIDRGNPVRPVDVGIDELDVLRKKVAKIQAQVCLDSTDPHDNPKLSSR